MAAGLISDNDPIVPVRYVRVWSCSDGSTRIETVGRGHERLSKTGLSVSSDDVNRRTGLNGTAN